MARTLSLVVRNVMFTIVVPGLGGVLAPWWILRSHGGATVAAWEAVPVIAAGAALYAWCVWNFAAVGDGTPGLWDAPRRVVATGPYRWEQDSPRLPDWPTSHRHLVADGQPAELTHPSDANQTRAFPPPVVSAGP